jgi:uncharacterized membrane protein YbhN (UPF0104 family)
MKKRLVRLLAWAVTAGLLVLLFHKIPFHEVVAAARGAAGWTVPAAFFFGFVIYLADSFAIWKTFGWFLAELSLADVLLVRGATYLLAAINYNVGQGAIVYFVHRVARVPVIRGVATVLLIMGINVLALLFLATFGLAAAPAVPHALKLIVAVAYTGLAVYVAAIVAKPRWLASRPLFDVLLGAGLGGHARALLVRLPHIAILFAFQICMLRGFGVAVPILQAIAALPVVFFIAVLPISVQGLGTTQAAMIFFFARYAPGDSHAQQAAVLAASLVGQVCTLTFQIVLGVACLKSRVGRAVTEASQEASKAAATAEA